MTGEGQLPLGGGFTLDKSKSSSVGVIDRPKPNESPIVKASTSFERQTVLNEEAVMNAFKELLPRLFKIPKGQKIKTAFESGGYGWVQLLKPVYATYAETVGKDKCWIPRVPPVVKHPVYKNVWTLGFKDAIDPTTKIKTRRFNLIRIVYNRSDIRKAEERDLGEFTNTWRDIFAKKFV